MEQAISVEIFRDERSSLQIHFPIPNGGNKWYFPFVQYFLFSFSVETNQFPMVNNFVEEKEIENAASLYEKLTGI